MIISDHVAGEKILEFLLNIGVNLNNNKKLTEVLNSVLKHRELVPLEIFDYFSYFT